MDTAAAQRYPDVVRVLTEFNGVTLPYDPRQIAAFGQPVAVVIANTLEAASHAAALVEVRYDSTASLTDIDAPQAVPEPGQTARVADYARGDADAALRTAAVTSDLQYSIGRNNHNPMELPATIARWDGDQLTVWDKVQGITWSQQAYSKAFGIPADRVRVISPFVGGAFGSAGKTWPNGLLAAFAARQVGRPVKLTLTRKQFYSVVGYRPTSRQRLAIGADRIRTHHRDHSRSTRGEFALRRLRGQRHGGATLPIRLAQHAVDLSNGASGRQPAHLHARTRIDQRGVRARVGNGRSRVPARHGPHRAAVAQRTLARPDRRLPFSTRRLTECFSQGAATFGWSRRNATPRATREGNLLIGMGTAAGVYHTQANTCTVAISINRDGTADVRTGTSDMGPGTYTSMTQVAADALGLPMSRVRFALGDSQMPQAPVHGGSQTMASVGSGVFNAANMLRDRFIRTAVVDPASPLTGLRPEQVIVTDGRMTAASDPSRGESYQDLLRRRGWGPLDATETWTPNEAEHDRYSMHAYGAVFAEVAVDEQLGTTRVRRMYAVYDAGRIINPMLAHSQAIGGMVGGIGMALLESTELDHRDGRIVNANMADYLVPVNADISDLDAAFLPGEDTIADPLGVKGLAELVFVGVPAAIANAVFNATGRRITDLPITLDKLI